MSRPAESWRPVPVRTKATEDPHPGPRIKYGASSLPLLRRRTGTAGEGITYGCIGVLRLKDANTPESCQLGIGHKATSASWTAMGADERLLSYPRITDYRPILGDIVQMHNQRNSMGEVKRLRETFYGV